MKKFKKNVETQILNEFITAGIQEAQIDVKNILGQPGFRKYEQQGESIYYELGISTNPVIDLSTNYSNIIPSYVKPKVKPKDLDAKLAEIALQQAPFTKVKIEKSVENGDVAVIDFEGFIGSEVFDGGSAKNFKLKIGSNSFIAGFEEQLIDMDVNEEKTVIITFAKNYASADLAGKEAHFIVKLLEIQEQVPLKIDSALAQKVLQDPSATLKMLREKLKEQLASQALSSLYLNKLKPKLVKGLLKKFNFTLPINVVEQEIDAKVHAILEKMDKKELELQKNDKEKFHALRDSVRQKAQDSIKSALIVEALANKEKIVIEDKEAIEALKYQAAMIGKDSKELIKYYQDNNLMTSVKIRLTEDRLLQKILKLNT